MKWFMYLWIFVSFVGLVYAEACVFYDDDIMTIDEFLLINDSELLDFNSLLLYNYSSTADTIYVIKMDVYELIWEYIDDDDDEWTDPVATPMIIPVLMIFNWYCDEEVCDGSAFILEQENWYFDSYQGIKEPYE